MVVVTCLELLFESGAGPNLRRGGGGSELRCGALDDGAIDDRFSAGHQSIFFKSVVHIYSSGRKVGSS